MKVLIFDFNGTVLDDVDLSLDCLNELVNRYLKRNKLSKEEYLDIFTFPVFEYYRQVGFNVSKEKFQEIGKVWHSLYWQDESKFKLFDDFISFIKRKKEEGIYTVLLSASFKEDLLKQCEILNISKYFDAILGIDNIYAGSKMDLAKDYLNSIKEDKEVYFIGDTLHDYEVANELNAKCVLVSRGHQSLERLKKSKSKIISSFKEVEDVKNWPFS